MRTFLVLSMIVLFFGFFFTQVSYAGFAQPPLWESDFGIELTGLTGCDDCKEAVQLPFPFPFDNSHYNMAYVSTNGCIQLGGEGPGENDYQFWIFMEEFLADIYPIICPMETDWDLSFQNNGIGMIFYKQHSDRAVFTWHDIGSHENTSTNSTFQLVLHASGAIILNLNGILNGDDEDLIEDLDSGIIVGITPSDLLWDGEPFVPGDPGPNDLNAETFFYDRATIYERWCFEEADTCGTDEEEENLPGPPNDEFDLDFQSICFLPLGGGFEVSSAGAENTNFSCEAAPRPIPALSEWGLIAMAGLIGLAGLIFYRRKAAA